MESERILSIQSHVVFGYVGGKAAVFPLQLLGYDVDAVNTVHFSNHSGYGRFGGAKATAGELKNVFEELERNELMNQTRLLTGYVPGAEALSVVAGLARRLKERKKDLIYLLDPVIGDDGEMYVAADVIPVYRAMLPLATIISPNWFEVEVLTDTKLEDLISLRCAIKILHEEYKVTNVVISSIPMKPWLFDALPQNIRPPAAAADEDNEDRNYILCLTSSSDSDSDSLTFIHAYAIPLIPGYFSGVGDLFSALLIGHFKVLPRPASSDETPISVAASHALSKTYGILQATHKHTLTLPEDERLPSDTEEDRKEPLRQTRRMRGRELKLVQNQDVLRGIGVRKLELKVWKGFWEGGLDT